MLKIIIVVLTSRLLVTKVLLDYLRLFDFFDKGSLRVRKVQFFLTLFKWEGGAGAK